MTGYCPSKCDDWSSCSVVLMLWLLWGVLRCSIEKCSEAQIDAHDVWRVDFIFPWLATRMVAVEKVSAGARGIGRQTVSLRVLV